MNDIAEIQQDPYPNVHLHFDDADIRKACLILTPEDEEPLPLAEPLASPPPESPEAELDILVVGRGGE